MRTRPVGLVARREISERLRGRATWIVTAVTAAVAVALIVVPALANQAQGPVRLGLVGHRAQSLAPAISVAARTAGIALTISDIPDEATARSELTPPKTTPGGGGRRLGQLFGQNPAAVDLALLYDGNSGTVEAYETVPTAVSGLLRAVLSAVHQREVLSSAGVPPAQIAEAEQPVPLATVTLQPAVPDQAGRSVAAIAAGFLLMYSVSGFGAAVAIGVAQEKTSRTAEVLLGAVTPRELMSGKVLGIGVVGLTQVVVTLGAALIANSLVKSTQVPPELTNLLPVVLLWFLLGFTLYAFGFAAAGAMVARQEEVQGVSAPFSVFLAASIFLVYATIASPDSAVLKVLSFFPPTSPILMPARIALGHTATWELPVAAAIEVVAIVAMARLAGRIYQLALVRGGAKLSWSAAIRGM